MHVWVCLSVPCRPIYVTCHKEREKFMLHKQIATAITVAFAAFFAIPFNWYFTDCHRNAFISICFNISFFCSFILCFYVNSLAVNSNESTKKKRKTTKCNGQENRMHLVIHLPLQRINCVECDCEYEYELMCLYFFLLSMYTNQTATIT